MYNVCIYKCVHSRYLWRIRIWRVSGIFFGLKFRLPVVFSVDIASTPRSRSIVNVYNNIIRPKWEKSTTHSKSRTLLFYDCTRIPYSLPAALLMIPTPSFCGRTELHATATSKPNKTAVTLIIIIVYLRIQYYNVL